MIRNFHIFVIEIILMLKQTEISVTISESESNNHFSSLSSFFPKNILNFWLLCARPDIPKLFSHGPLSKFYWFWLIAYSYKFYHIPKTQQRISRIDLTIEIYIVTEFQPRINSFLKRKGELIDQLINWLCFQKREFHPTLPFTFTHSRRNQSDITYNISKTPHSEW